MKGIDLTVLSGEMLAIEGASGAGKSTLLHILGALDRPTAGEIYFQGEDLLGRGEKDLAEIRNRYVGFVFQFHHLLPEFTALENTILPGLIQGMKSEEALQGGERILVQLGLGDRLLHKPGELSGGEQQRVAIARALTMNPKILLADEPTGNLATAQSEEIMKIFTDLKSRKKWIDAVVVTGGEPTLQSDLPQFLKKLKKLGFNTMIETNGSRPEVLKKIIKDKLLDFIAMDYKTTFASYSKTVKGKNVKVKSKVGKEKDITDKLKKSIEIVLKSKLPFELRTTVVPSIHDQEVLVHMAQDLKKLTADNLSLTTISWVFQSFQPKNCLVARFNKKDPIPDQKILNWLKEVKKSFSCISFKGEKA